MTNMTGVVETTGMDASAMPLAAPLPGMLLLAWIIGFLVAIVALVLRIIADRIDHGEAISELDEMFAVPA